MEKRRPGETVQVNLRLREDFRQKLLREAQKAGRSFNQELVHRLEQSFEREEKGLILSRLDRLDRAIAEYGRPTLAGGSLPRRKGEKE